MQKNTAGKWVVFAFDRTDNTPLTGDAGNITANIRIDGGAANSVDDVNPTELEDGYYIFDITATEANGDNLLLTAASATSDIQVVACPPAVWTRPPNFETLGITAGAIDDVTTVATTTINSDMVAAAPTAAAVADAVWDETMAGHTTADTSGLVMNEWQDGGRLDLIIDATLADTADIQPNYATSTELGKVPKSDGTSSWNATALASINAEVDTALTDIHLDHLMAAAAADVVVDGSVIAHIVSATEDWSTFAPSTDSLQAVRDRGDAAWTTGATAPTAAAVADAVWDEDATGHQTTGTFGQAIGDPGANTETMYDAVITDAAGTNVAGDVAALNDVAATDIVSSGAITTLAGAVVNVDLVDTLTTYTGNTVQTGDSFARLGAPAGASVSADIAVIEGQTDDIGVAGVGLTDLGGMSSAMKAEVNAEADTALTDYDPPTKTEMDALLTTALTESYAANGVAPTLTQAVMAIHQVLMDFSITATTTTVEKLDGTTAFVMTLDDATNPTSANRA